MSIRLRQFLAAAVLAAAAATGVLSAHTSGSAVADPVCPNSTNWDNVLQICK